MNKWLGAAMAAVAMLAAMPAAQSARATATMEVSFRVVEACAIRSAADASGQDAEVHCQYQTPYQIQSGAQPAQGAAQAPRRAERPADVDAPAALTVWF